ncbi:MAG TPA: nuclear transport factor 2 family protein [Chitinophagaceae bacterium]|jgi:ketosteroid isomerase-like protein
MKIEQTPITGNENKEHLSEPQHILSEFYHAFNCKDLEKISAIWAHSDEVIAQNPAGGIKQGWKEIENVYKLIFQSGTNVKAEFYDYSIHEAGEMFYTVGKEKVRMEKDGETITLTVRISRIFKMIDFQWKQVHLHGSIDDAKLLEQYQKATKSN